MGLGCCVHSDTVRIVGGAGGVIWTVFIQTLSGLWPGRVSGWGWGCDLDSVHSDTVRIVVWKSQ